MKRRTSGLTSALLLLAAVLTPPSLLAAQDVTAAVAANFILPFKELAGVFEQQTGLRLRATFASTGRLYAQIRNGAPYDIFLAADQARPRMLHREGLAGKPFVYAKGRVVLWTAKRELCRLPEWRGVIESPFALRVAVANPETAPYGAAAVEALRVSGLWSLARSNLIYAQSVAQCFQYAHTRAADAAFCALSSAMSELGRRGCHWAVGQAPAVVQAACLLKTGTPSEGTQEFAAFLGSAQAREIKERHGYE